MEHNNVKAIYFDMDGTLANFYGVETWLEDIRNFNVRPYNICKPLLDLKVLENKLITLQKLGYKIGIITWGSKTTTDEFLIDTGFTKLKWLAKYMPNIIFDEIHITKYGVDKYNIANIKESIIFDDSVDVRNTWYGLAYDEKNIFNILDNLININRLAA